MLPSTLLSRRHWIFDLDGTLTRPIHDFAAIRAELGVPTGRGILEHLDAQPPARREPLERRLIEIERGLAERAEANPGAVDFLRFLDRGGCRLAVFTRNRRDCVGISLRRLGVAELFEPACIQACDDAPPKPDPWAIHALLRHWGAAADESLIVGDFLYDLQAGREAGIGTLHYHADGAPARHWPALTDLRVGSFTELRRLVKRARNAG